jgi:hypothetical protein
MEKGKNDIKKRIKSMRINPWIAGAIIGFLAASLQQIASMTKPPAYGFCMACHARDLINGLINIAAGTKLGVADIVKIGIIPTLTIIGVLLGSFVAAKIYKEFRVTKAVSRLSMFKMFLLGFLVMNFALILSACPIRASLRVAHGDIVALVGLFCIGIGAIVGTILLERSVKV